VVTVKKTDEAEGITLFYPSPPFFSSNFPPIKDSLALLGGLRTQLRPPHPVGRVQRRESLPDLNVQQIQAQSMSVPQLAESEKLRPRNLLHNPPHDLKRLVYSQLLQDPQPLRSRRNIKMSFLLSHLLPSPWYRLHCHHLLSVQTLALFYRKLPTTLQLCGLSLPNLNNPHCPRHLRVYILLPVCWHPQVFLPQHGPKQPTLHSHKFLIKCHHRHRL